MQIYFIIILLFAVLVAIFAVQNAYPVTIYFLKWKFEATFGLVILVSLLLGAVSLGSLGLLHQAKNKLKKRTRHKDGTEDGEAPALSTPENQRTAGGADLGAEANEVGGDDDSPQEVES